LWGQCPHNLRIQTVEVDVSVELASVAARYSNGAKPVGEVVEETLTILAPVLTSQLESLDVAADEPVPQREAEVDSPARLHSKLVVDRANLDDELLEVHAPAFLFRVGAAFARSLVDGADARRARPTRSVIQASMSCRRNRHSPPTLNAGRSPRWAIE
jgi:hypothetical protein